MSDVTHSTREPMLPVSADRPCPACHKSDWCLLRGDGKRGICSRVESATRAGDAGWLHIYEDDPFPETSSRPRTKSRKPKPTTGGEESSPSPSPSPSPAGAAASPSGSQPKPPAPLIDWQVEADRYVSLISPAHRAHLADLFRVPIDVITTHFPFVGVCEIVASQPVFTFPEYDAASTVVGITKRYPRGTGPILNNKQTDKPAIKGSARGLTIPAEWRGALASGSNTTPVFIVEGASDTVVMTAAGLTAIGRPESAAGGKEIAELLHSLAATRPVVVVGENDRKTDGKWPGLLGARTLAEQLARRLHRTVLLALPPDDAKDVREWLTHASRLDTPFADRGRSLSAALLSAAHPIRELDDPNEWDCTPDNPHRLAAAYLAHITPDGEPLRLRHWREQFREWVTGAYRTIEIDDMSTRLNGWLKFEFDRVYQLELSAWESKPSDARTGSKPKKQSVTISLVTNTLAAIKSLSRIPPHVTAPAWLDDATGPEPRDLVPVRNGLVDVTDGTLLPPSASFFSFAVSPFEYDPTAATPHEWIRFLSSVWPNDPHSIECLQEWFGYLLTPDTSQQKMLFVKGPTRSGKGTISHVLQKLIGEHNIIHPDLFSLSDRFGLAPLFDKSVALVADLRLVASGESMARIVGNLLKISGEDTITSDRKNLSVITDRVPTRLVIMSNELPDIGDSSGALFGRIILLRMTESFFGREDKGLKDRLTTSAELAGIMNWAIAGLSRLRARGGFRQPQSGKGELAAMRSAGANVATFIREECRLGSEYSVAKSELYDEWKNWCKTNDLKPGTSAKFASRLYAAAPGVDQCRPDIDGSRERHYSGIRIRKTYESQDDYGEDNKNSDSDNYDSYSAGESSSRPGSVQVRPTEAPLSTPSNFSLRPSSPSKSLHSSRAREENNSGDRGDDSPAHTRKMSETTWTTWTEAEIARGSAQPPTWTGLDGTWTEPVSEWLYLSGKLEVLFLPLQQREPEVEISGTKYYRMSPGLLAEIERKGDSYARQHPDPESIARWAESMQPVYQFTERAFRDNTLSPDSPHASQEPRSPV